MPVVGEIKKPHFEVGPDYWRFLNHEVLKMPIRQIINTIPNALRINFSIPVISAGPVGVRFDWAKVIMSTTVIINETANVSIQNDGFPEILDKITS